MLHTCFSGRGALRKGVTDSGPVRLPPPGLFHHGVPSFCSHGVLATLPPHRRILCQVLACRWHEGLKCTCRPTAGGAPSRPVASPRSHSSWSPTNNHHNCISLGRAMGLWVIAVGVRPTIITTAIHKSPKRYRISCVRSTNIRTYCDPSQLHHTPLKNARLQCPRHVMRRNNRHGGCPPEELPRSPREPRPLQKLTCAKSGARK